MADCTLLANCTPPRDKGIFVINANLHHSRQRLIRSSVKRKKRGGLSFEIDINLVAVLMEGRNYGFARQRILAFQEVVVSYKNRLDYCLRHHAKIIGVATMKRDELVKDLETLRGESEKLNRDIAAMGLIYCFKMLQLKLRYQMEIDNAMGELKQEIIGLALKQKEAIREIQKLKELREHIEIYLIRIHFVLKVLAVHEDLNFQRQGEIPKAD